MPHLLDVSSVASSVVEGESKGPRAKSHRIHERPSLLTLLSPLNGDRSRHLARQVRLGVGLPRAIQLFDGQLSLARRISGL